MRLLALLLMLALVVTACAPKEQAPTTPTTPTTPGAPTPTAPGQKIAWRANAIIPKGQSTPTRAPYDDLMRRITERTGGRLEIQTHWIGELGFGVRDWPKILKEGLVEINDLPMLMGSAYIPELGYETYALHLGPPPDFDRIVAVHEGRRPIYDEIIADWGGRRLASFYLLPVVSPQSEMASTRPYYSLAEMRGKIRRAMGPEEAAFWAKFGVKTVLIPPYENYMALKTGLVDMTRLGSNSYKDYLLHEVAKYLIVWYPGASSLTAWGWAASERHWAELPPDIQKIVADAYKEYQDEIDALSTSKFVFPDDAEIDKIIKEYGITVIQLPPGDIDAIISLADQETARWLVTTSDLGRSLFKSDMQALGRPERFDQLMELGKQIVGK